MVCTARARAQLYELDAKWMLKFRLRIAHNIFCVTSIGAAAIVLGRESNYQPNAWKYSRAVAYYVPFVRFSPAEYMPAHLRSNTSRLSSHSFGTWPTSFS
jgi:hypothetical protein